MWIEGEDFEFVERPGSELYSVRLRTTDWAGVIYTYGRVSFNFDEAQDRMKLSYQLRVEEPTTRFTVSEIERSPTFQQLTGDILSSILSTKEARIGKPDDKPLND